MIRRAALGSLLTVTAACTAVPADVEEVPIHGAGRCDASRAQSLVGRAATAALGAEAMRMSGATALRWIHPDSVVTMEFREDRLNVDLDAKNRVTGLRCG